MIKIITKDLVGILLSMSLLMTPNEFISADNSISKSGIESAAIQGALAEDVIERYSDTEYNYLINLTKETACISSWKGLFNENFKDIKDIILPTDVSYNEKKYPITELGTGAFNQEYGDEEIGLYIESLAIPEGYEKIDFDAIGHAPYLEKVVIPSSVIEIGSNFHRCKALDKLTMASNKNFICEAGMLFSKDKTVLISAFHVEGTCEVPEGVTTIEAYSFAWAGFDNEGERLNKVILPSTLAVIKEYAFKDCTLKSINIPSGVTEIPDDCFSNSGLNQITIPEGVITIGEGAFDSCRIHDLFIPSTVKEMGYYRDMTISGNNPYLSVKDNALFSKDGKTLIKTGAFYENDTYFIPKGVVTIREGAFLYAGFSAVVIPEGVTELCNNLFLGCGNLSKITLPSTLKSIGSYIICNTKVRELILPEGLEKLSENAFSLSLLDSLTLPASLKTIGKNIFTENSSAVNIQFLGKTPPAIETQNDNSINTVIIPKGTKAAYKNALKGKTENQNLTEDIELYVSSNEHAQIIVKIVTGGQLDDYEYSLNGKNYKKGHIFNSVTPNKTYTVYAKKNGKVITAKLKVKSLVTFIDSTFVELENHEIIFSYDNNSVDFMYEYKIGKGEWKGEPYFDNLKPNTSYTIYRRRKSSGKINNNKIIKETISTKKE